MITLNTKLRRVGNSLGIVVPSNFINDKNLREGSDIIVNIQHKNRTTVGDMLNEAKKQKLKFRRSTEEILKEIDEDE